MCVQQRVVSLHTSGVVPQIAQLYSGLQYDELLSTQNNGPLFNRHFWSPSSGGPNADTVAGNWQSWVVGHSSSCVVGDGEGAGVVGGGEGDGGGGAGGGQYVYPVPVQSCVVSLQ